MKQWTLALNISDSFAQLYAKSEAETYHTSWYMPQKSIETALKEFTEKHEIKKIDKFFYNNKLPFLLVQNNLGHSPGVLFTNGFENWLHMTLPLKKKYLTSVPFRQKNILNNDLVFGVSERTNTNGEITHVVSSEELEFIASKLQLEGIKTIAICFLNSPQNPQNEIVAKDFFKERGFVVYTSHQSPSNNDEKARWWHPITNAYAHHLSIEALNLINNAIETLELEINEFYGPTANDSGGYDWLTHSFGILEGINYYFAKESLKNVLYCGLEDWALIASHKKPKNTWNSRLGQVAVSSPDFMRLAIQPTQLINNHFFGTLQTHIKEVGFEPGPMCFGRSLKLTFFDILFIAKLLPKLPECPIDAKSKNKILDAIWTQTKSVHSDDFSSDDIIDETIKYFSELLFIELKNTIDSETITLIGPMAETVKSLLKPFNIKVKIFSDSDCEARFTCKGVDV